MSYSKKNVASVHFPNFKSGLPSMKGKTVVITGTTSGTGWVAATTLAELGAKLLLLNRKSERSEKSFQDLKSKFPNSEIHKVECDLQSFSSVRKASQEVIQLCPEGVHVLCNNAGVMALKDEATEDGYDVQMQTNHLSHFLLTSELYPLLEKASESSGESRIVNHSSVARMSPSKTLKEQYLGKNGGNLGGDGASMIFGGARWKRYNQTKLANAAFTAALHEKLQKKGSKIKALVAHPGLANTELQVSSVRDGGMGSFFTGIFMGLGQSMEDGAMGILACMCLAEAKSGEFYGPGSGPMALKGEAKPFPLESFYDNPKTRELLWKKSCEAIGKEFTIS
ncbi:MAG: SDR family NAD(P)-dependent oxidoreductase [Leptospiraceae bacterium]|nr:SDR family NAD(P)-dependent oxidoreductase [Leptospiraceae bacterium]MCP5510843.1 SDR family NAD(P)-dependent oxidoreductase [Leptospiraceae bacterium]